MKNATYILFKTSEAQNKTSNWHDWLTYFKVMTNDHRKFKFSAYSSFDESESTESQSPQLSSSLS